MSVSFFLLNKCNEFMIIRELLDGDSNGLLKLPTDKSLLEDSQFRHYVELYAQVSWAINRNCISLSVCFV